MDTTRDLLVGLLDPLFLMAINHVNMVCLKNYVDIPIVAYSNYSNVFVWGEAQRRQLRMFDLDCTAQEYHN